MWDFNLDGYINVYRKVWFSPAFAREQRVWLQHHVAIDELMNRDFMSAMRWLHEVY